MKKLPFPIKEYSGLSFGDDFVRALEMVHIEIIVNGTKADKAIREAFLQQPLWKSGRKGWFALMTYDLVRWRRLLEALCKTNHTRKLISAFCSLNQIVEETTETKPLSSLSSYSLSPEKLTRAELLSVPDWFDEAGYGELADRWETEINAMNQWPVQALRCNPLKTNRNKLSELLTQEGWSVSLPEGYPLALILNSRGNIFLSPWFQKGYFEVQDPSSQRVSEFLEVRPGLRVIDACAGTGGKSLHLAALMQNKGKLLALDTVDWKLDITSRRAVRAGVDILETRPITSTKVIKRLKNSTERLLLDVPCSGSGVLRRNPDIRWRVRQDHLSELRELQEYIINYYSRMVKPGGLMVYSTCSIFPSENQEQIKKFLGTEIGQQFSLVDEIMLWPSETNFDGFFMAKLKKAL